MTGFPDCKLIISQRVLFCEIKYGSNKPSDAQTTVLNLLYELRHPVNVCNSVSSYYRWLLAEGVKLRAQAQIIAEDLDRRVLVRVMAAEAAEASKPKRKARARPTPRYTAGKRMVQRLAKAGVRI